jgi:bacterioferritin-associated ferredoxin
MYVCVCLAVSEREVEAAIDGGAHSVADVTRACRAGGDCGACRGHIAEMIEDRQELLSPSSLLRVRAA